MKSEDRHHRSSVNNDGNNDEEDSEEEKSVFRPYTRESLIESEARIAQEEAKRNERKKKREEGEVRFIFFNSHSFKSYLSLQLVELILSPFRRIGDTNLLRFKEKKSLIRWSCLIFLYFRFQILLCVDWAWGCLF